MYTGQIISGAGHGALILWLLLGNFLFSPPEPQQLEATNVSMISSAELAAMQAAAAGAITDTPPDVVEPVAETPAKPVAVEPPPEPQVEQPPPEPVQEPPPPEVTEPLPELVPEGPTGEATPQPLPPSDDPQPVPTPLADARPRPRPADLVAPVPVEETPDVETSPTPEQAVSEVPTEEPVIEEPPVEETAPEAAATELVPEQLDEPEVATLAPATSPRPRARPAPPAEPDPVVEDTPAEQPATEPAPDPATDQAAIDEALAAALAEEAPAEEPATESPPTGAGGTPLGQALTAGELGDFRAQVQQRWNVGALSTEALAVSVTIAVTVGPDGVPDAGSVRMVAATGGSDAAINAAYEVAKRAILTAGRRGLALPLDKYETWRELEITFDASSRQLR